VALTAASPVCPDIPATYTVITPQRANPAAPLYAIGMHAPPIPRWLIPRLPFFYGWIILGCACCAGLSRQGGAVATLSVFVAPMTAHFGWSRTAISGAVSLGGLLAAVAAPTLGRLLDREGARVILCAAVVTTGLANMALSLTVSLPMFYLLFCVARLNFAGPFDLGIYGAVNSWFIARRSLANGIASMGQMAGLVALPLIGSLAMLKGGWQAGWLAIGITVLLVGFVPAFLLMVRAPEDVGLLPDGYREIHHSGPRPSHRDPVFTRAQAVRTKSFWLLSLFTLLAYPVQAGVSLHQAPFLIERGLSAPVAASVVSYFSLMSGVASFGFGVLPRWLTARLRLILTGALLCIGSGLYQLVHGAAAGYLAATFFGLGVGGLLIMLPIAWADYFGRNNYGSIRGLALTGQVLAQAAGPLLSGVLRDATGGYETSLACFAALSGLSAIAAILATPPTLPTVPRY
jgi:OFA family oxalate/formate antiporter-like MFS transporter